jgi:membrane fusion protein, multidrug efflux system
MKVTTWILVGTVGTSLMAAIGYAAVHHLIQTNPIIARKVQGAMPVQVTAVAPTDLTEIVGASGQVQPIAILNITARPPTHGGSLIRVDKVAVDIGDLVTPRQLLIQFDRAVLQAAVATAEAAVSQAIEEVERTRLYVQRIKAIYDERLLPKVELEKAQAAFAEANTLYQRAQEQRLQAKKDMQNSTITSPVLGVVMERQINAGETPGSDQKLLTLGRIDHVLIETKVTEDRADDVHLHQTATVTFNAFPNDVMTGQVVKIKPVTDPSTKTFLVYVKVANKKQKLKPGMSSFVRLKRTHHVLAVPSIALINPTGVEDSSVFIITDDNRAQLRKVKIGVAAEGMTQVLNGLVSGEQVVVVGQLYLRDGDPVRIGDEFDRVKAQFAGAPKADAVSGGTPR